MQYQWENEYHFQYDMIQMLISESIYATVSANAPNSYLVLF